MEAANPPDGGGASASDAAAAGHASDKAVAAMAGATGTGGDAPSTPSKSSGTALPIEPRTPGGSDDDGGRAPRPFLEIETEGDDGDTLSPLLSPGGRKISLDLTPLSCKSTNSSHEYHQPNQTIIIFDWDDTLCPSTTCMRLHGLSVLGDPPEGDLARQLEEHTLIAKEVIERAQELASKVVVVTNAEEGWVDLSCKAWMPALKETLENCEVASARSNWEPRGVQSPAGWKAREFESIIDRFYSQYEQQSWKNIISIGDAPHEREALHRVARWAPQGKKCRSKSVKFVLRPSVEQITRELQMLRESLRDIVFHDDDLDLHFSVESLNDP